tara:strand:+ start:1725 stop:2753 length:1029 start_codon:yes stop_codon:yes gene_type:complete
MKNNKINAAIIGAGRMGQIYYNLLKKFNTKIVGVLDNSNSVLKKFQLKNRIPSKCIFSNSNKLFKIKKLNLIIISTTTDQHYFYIKKALDNNAKYILVEKPLCRSINEAKEVLKGLKNKKTRLLVNHNQKETYEFNKIKKLAEKNNLGKLKSVTVVAGNMGLAMNGVHYLDTFQHFTGKLLDEVSAHFEDVRLYNPRGKKFIDKSGIIISKNRINQKIIINASAYQGHARQVTFAYQTGIINFNLINGRLELLFRKKKYIGKPTYLYSLPSINKNYKIKISDLSYSISKNLKKLISSRDISKELAVSANNVKILVASYVSNSSGGKKINISKIQNNKKFPWA